MKDLFKRREDLLPLTLAAAFAASGLLLFGPIQMYVANLTELWFPIIDVLWPSLIAFVLAWGALTAFGVVFKGWSGGYMSLLCGLGLALYVQGNFLPSDHGILNGQAIDWDAQGNAAALNAMIWAACIILPFAVRVFFPERHKTAVVYLSAGLILVQSVAAVMLCLTTDLTQTAAEGSYLSSEGLYEVSEEQNVVIFILDTFDQKFFQEVYAADPGVVDLLDGFTYFENATGPYPNTRAALPYLLTGQYYENEQPYAGYVEEAWRESAGYYQALRDEGFGVGIYTAMGAAVSDEAKQGLIDNAVGSGLKVSSHVGLEKAMLQLTAMRFFPEALKRYVWASGDLFGNLRAGGDADASPFSEEEQDAVFYQGLVSQGLTAVEGKRYRFIHLDGTHEPYTVLEDVSEVPEGTGASALTEARGCLNILKEYIRQLKELGVYDQTCLIVTGDHGFSAQTKAVPILMVKGFQDSGAFRYSDVPVSHSNVMATVMAELGLEDADRFGTSVFAAGGAPAERRRYLQYTLNDSYDKEYLPDMTEYQILPDGNTAEHFILTGKTYTPGGLVETDPYRYEVGEAIDFVDSEALSYFLSGVPAYVEGDFVWTSGHSGRACFQTGEVDEDLVCRILLREYVPTGAQRIAVSSQGVPLYEGSVISGMYSINFAVPKGCIQDGLLVLDFAYPDACSSKSLGLSEDTRDIAIGIKQIRFTRQEEAQRIVFSKDGDCGDHLYDGWHAIEDAWSWTSQAASLLAVLPGETDRQMSVTYWTHPGAKDTDVYYNGEHVGVLPHRSDAEKGTQTILLPAQYRSDGGAQVITFVTDGATTSKDYYGGDVTDTRVLGIAVSEVSFP